MTIKRNCHDSLVFEAIKKWCTGLFSWLPHITSSLAATTPPSARAADNFTEHAFTIMLRQLLHLRIQASADLALSQGNEPSADSAPAAAAPAPAPAPAAAGNRTAAQQALDADVARVQGSLGAEFKADYKVTKEYCFDGGACIGLRCFDAGAPDNRQPKDRLHLQGSDTQIANQTARI